MTRMARLTGAAIADRITILPTATRLSRILIFGRLGFLALLDRMAIQTSASSMERPNVGDRQEELYRLTVMATIARLTGAVGPSSWHSANRC